MPTSFEDPEQGTGGGGAARARTVRRWKTRTERRCWGGPMPLRASRMTGALGQMSTRRVAGNDDACPVAPVFVGVPVHPSQRSHHLQDDVLDAHCGAKRVVRQDDHGTRVDERRGDEGGCAWRERANPRHVCRREPVRSTGWVEKHGDVPSGPVRSPLDDVVMSLEGVRRSRDPVVKDRRMLRNSCAAVVLRVEPSRRGPLLSRGHQTERSLITGANLLATGFARGLRKPRGSGSTPDSRRAASISASAIQRAVRSTSRSGRPQMSFKIT